MLVYTGTRLASPSEVVHAKKVGLDQLVLFGATLFVTLAEDLLLGIAVGVVLKIVLHAIRAKSLTALFTTEVESERRDPKLTIRVKGPATFLSLLEVRKALEVGFDPKIESIVLDLSEAPVVDHTFLERVHGLVNEMEGTELETIGQDHLAPMSEHPFAARRVVRAS